MRFMGGISQRFEGGQVVGTGANRLSDSGLARPFFLDRKSPAARQGHTRHATANRRTACLHLSTAQNKFARTATADLNNLSDYSCGACEIGAIKIAPSSHIGQIPDEVHSAVEVILPARKMWENPAGCASFTATAKPFQPTDFPQPRRPNPSPFLRVHSSPPMARTAPPVRMRESPFPRSSFLP